MKTGVLLINLGTPDSGSVRDVRRYLNQFLVDERVIDLSALTRYLVFRGIVVPFRAPKSAGRYREIWLPEGSPLMVHSRALEKAVAAELGPEFEVALGMRYGNPSIESALDRLRAVSVREIVVVPLFPQYASSTVGSALTELFRVLRKWQVIPSIRIASEFHEHSAYIDAFVARGREHRHEDYDHILFSFHGVPERHIDKAHAHYGGSCEALGCEHRYGDANRYCYRAACFATARTLASRLGIPGERYTVCFQSLLGRDPWIGPYTDNVMKSLAQGGKTKLLVFSPAFVADCLETLHEIGIEYEEFFRKAGGTELKLVESLNASPVWVRGLSGLIRELVAGSPALSH